MMRFSLIRNIQVITLSDLECDYLNAQQCCSKLNMVYFCFHIRFTKYDRIYSISLFLLQWVVPKMIAHTILTFLLLIHGQVILTLVNLPMTAWLLYEFFGVPSGNMGVYDPTEIHNRGQLKRHTRDCMVYLGYYLVFFFIYLYW